MKQILVLIGGGDRDEIILRTGLAAAVPLSAHLNLLHVHVSAARAARYAGVDFAVGDGLRNALSRLETKASKFSGLAADHVHEFCASERIEICDVQNRSNNVVTASYCEESDLPIEHLVFHARRNDLVVLGRGKQTQGLSADTLDHLILNCGRPVLVAATAAPRTLTGTIMVCWNQSDAAARAVAAAAPILTTAKHVVFTNIAERDGEGAAVHELAQRFARIGLSTDAQIIPANGDEIPDLLSAAAEDCGADLVVMGAYGHSRVRELVFGSCTEAFMRTANRPVLLMH